ncbi:SpoIID/LytB domain-containing protein [Paludibacteraceae bacterium OttesenSCG-928-F17]|nr:SpoIID/LytB domain-containing protein [Paludibacteraceae bacterium OttesenSCG-928-F17]
MREPLILVGIMSGNKIRFVLNDIFRTQNGTKLGGEHEVEYYQSKIKFDGQLYDSLDFLSSSDNASFDLMDVTIGINFHWERKETQRFKGNLKFIVENDKITAINEIRTEDYLTSVISSEMSASSSDELLKAHAVISRSWLLANLDISSQNKATVHNTENEFIKWYERDAHINFHVCADDHCQRYQGITKASTEAVEKAIKETYGKVLMYDNQICDARFSKCCGGISEDFENVWAEEHYPYLTAIRDDESTGDLPDLTIEKNAEEWIRNSPAAFCNTQDKKVLSQVLNNYDQETADFYRWKVQYTQQELSVLIQKKSGIDFGEILDLIPLERGQSGRIIKLKIAGTKQSLTVGKELEIRKWLSESHLYSSAFVVEKSEGANNIPQRFTLTGAGWGHGVGLCQIGAAVMGEKGYNYQEILQHYFKNTKLNKLY